VKVPLDKPIENRTIIIVFHGLSTIQYSDVIFYLEHGNNNTRAQFKKCKFCIIFTNYRVNCKYILVYIYLKFEKSLVKMN